MSFQEFPKSVYHKDCKLNAKGHPENQDHHKVVNSAEEQEALGSDWIEGPEFVGGSKPKTEKKPKGEKKSEE